VRVTLLEVFHHHGRLIQRQVTVDQGRHTAVRIYLGQLGRQATGVDIDDLHADTLLGQHKAYPMRIVISGIGIAG